MIPLAIITKVKEISGADPNVVTIVWRGQVFKATLMAGVAVAVGDAVIAEYIPASSEWRVITVV